MYGGSMYGAVDGILMVMFINLLDRKYIVWDKSGTNGIDLVDEDGNVCAEIDKLLHFRRKPPRE